MRNTSRKTLTGVVVSAAKTPKTIIVAVETYKKHYLYSKRFKSTKRFAVHDENQDAKLNDVVTIMETRPYSKTKYFRLISVKNNGNGVN